MLEISPDALFTAIVLVAIAAWIALLLVLNPPPERPRRRPFEEP